MEYTKAVIQLRKGREKPILNKHPWIFSGSISEVRGQNIQPGDLVEVVDAGDQWLARAYYNPRSQIQARILTWNPDEVIDENFWLARIKRALEFRGQLDFGSDTTAYRLFNAESDGIPGFVVDIYGDYLVMQCLTLGVDTRKQLFVKLLQELLNPAGIIERSDVNVRKKEGLEKVVAIHSEKQPPSIVQVLENGIKFEVNLYQGHKTGFYLDQRENRAIVCSPTRVKEREVLNVFSYTGGFALYAAIQGAARITNVDESATALNLAKRNMQINDLELRSDQFIQGDAFQVLRHFRSEDRCFDVIILDPPKFAHSQGDLPSATRGYKDLNLIALQLLRPDGLLATFSCSGLVSGQLFQQLLFSAAVDAGRDVQIIQQLGQSADHPILVTFPESAYLKGFVCRVL